MNAKQGRQFFAFEVKRCMCFRKPDMRCQRTELDRRVDLTLFIEDRFAKTIEMKATATLPVNCLTNAAPFTVNHFLQTRGAMRNSVFSHFDADITPIHFMCNGGGF